MHFKTKDKKPEGYLLRYFDSITQESSSGIEFYFKKIFETLKWKMNFQIAERKKKYFDWTILKSSSQSYSDIKQVRRRTKSKSMEKAPKNFLQTSAVRRGIIAQMPRNTELLSLQNNLHKIHRPNQAQSQVLPNVFILCFTLKSFNWFSNIFHSFRWQELGPLLH